MSLQTVRKGVLMPDRPNPVEPETAARHEPLETARHEPLETNQPDPMLQMSAGRMGSGGMSLVAIAIVVILVVVFYGLNGRNHESTPPQQPAAAMAKSGAPHG